MKKSLILLSILVMILSNTGCSVPVNQGNEAADSNPQVVLPEATPYIIYVTATPEVQGPLTENVLSISNDLLKGKMVYSKFISQDPVDVQLFVMNLDDGLERQITFKGINSGAVWSPDGTKILYASMSEETLNDICIMDESGDNAHTIVSTRGMDINAVWSPDGKMVAYSSDVDGNTEIYTINLETNTINQITSEDSGYHGAPSWSPDGKKLVYVYGDGIQHGTKLFTYDLESGVNEEIDSDKFYLDDMPIWSPDGQSILFSRINGDFQRIIIYDLNEREENLLTGNVFPEGNRESRVEKSAQGNFVSFSENGKFYIMDMNQRLIYPLGIDASDLHYFPQ